MTEVTVQYGGRDGSGSTVLRRDGSFSVQSESAVDGEESQSGRISDPASVFAEVEGIWAEGSSCNPEEPTHHEEITTVRVRFSDDPEDELGESRVLSAYPGGVLCEPLAEIETVVGKAIRNAH